MVLISISRCCNGGMGGWSDGGQTLTLCHGDCRNCIEISCGVLKPKTRVYITYMVRQFQTYQRGTIYSVLNPHVISAFGGRFLTNLHAIYSVSNKVASNKAKITAFLHLSYNYLRTCHPSSPNFELLKIVWPGRCGKKCQIPAKPS